MSFVDRDEWLAVIEADEIEKRLETEYVLRATQHGYDKHGKELSGIKTTREKLMQRREEILMTKPVDDHLKTWEFIRKSGGISS